MTRTFKPRTFLAFALFCGGILPLAAQTSATLSGTVTDATGAAVAGVAVTVTNSSTGVAREATTDSAGRYQAVSLPVGQYQIHASKSGFADEMRNGIELVVGQDATVDLKLNVGQAAQAVTVTEDAPLVDATTSDISGLVSGQQIRDLPLNGRSYDELLTLNPGVVNFTWEKIGGVGVSNSTRGTISRSSGTGRSRICFC